MSDRCHTGRFVKGGPDPCPHKLEPCPHCNGEGWIQEDRHKPGVRCPAGCDEGAIVVGRYSPEEIRYGR